MSKKKLALFQSVIALLLCLSMLVSTTFAWFTDSVKTGINTIASGVLDVELHHSNAAVTDQQVDTTTALFMDLQGNPILWEPGVVSYENLRVTNAGDLALAYQLSLATANENFVVEPSGAQYGLSQILKVGFVEGGITATDRDGVINSVDAANWTSLSNFLQQGSLLPEGAGEFEQVWGVVVYWQPGEYDNFWNLNNGKQLNEGEVLSIDLGVKLIATQEVYEEDAFGNDYDTTAKKDVFPVFVDANATVTVIPNAQNQTTEEVILTSGQVSAVVPAGTQLAAGVNQLTMTVTELEGTGSNVVLNAGEKMRSLDVHIEGVDATNTQPITVTLKEVAPTGLNMGNYDLYHVENGVTNKMTLVDTFDAHNQFKYDPATGDITLYMATFSEVALVAEPAKWEGGVDHSWYVGKDSPYTIANADQLWSFSQIVGGMAKDVTYPEGKTKDTFEGKTINLLSDINLGDKDDASTNLFYPIGYYNDAKSYTKPTDGTATAANVSSFQGTFDGQGHTIANFYQNTWQMWGNYDGNHYKAAMGLFGYVVNGTVKNLTVDHFSSDGEFTPTGVIAAYAVNSTFENIAITNCNPRVYNTGNGGIIGIAGRENEAVEEITLKNITVDNSNKITALWGSWDVACGGLVGMYRGNVDGSGNATGDTISFENCHVSAQIDVYNDVCANYQYYAYRYSGMIIGSVRHNTTNGDGKTIPAMTGISATNCTANFGTWNDYYYCELVDNTTASYTHDYQMSRLTEVKAINGTTITYLDGTTGTVPASGRANYVIVDYSKGHGTANATCYHFKDGAVWNHEEGGYHDGKDGGKIIDENGDGNPDLREDKQHLYLEFNNLFTGYGWGVSSKGLTDFEGVENMGITAGDQQESVEKFKVVENLHELPNKKAIKLGDIFVAKDGAKINSKAVVVSVTALEKNEDGTPTVTAKYVPAGEDKEWTEGTIEFTGIGSVQLSIQDYNFCTPTTITVNVTERQPVEKFATKFTGDFLYRVGNLNTVALDSLFKLADGIDTVGTVDVTIETVNDSGASGEYTPNATWTNGTIQFNGTGVVKVTITDNDYCTPTVLILEVVDATNVTGLSGAISGNVVLLNDCGLSSLTVSGRNTVYGNGFTATYTGNGQYLNNGLKQGVVTVSENGTLDNLRIVASIYPVAYLYSSELKDDLSDGNKRYFYQLSAVAASGNATISNCYIYGGRNNLFIGTGNVTVKGSVLECGTLANVQIISSEDYTVTFENVTTIQHRVNATIGDAAKVMFGAGILVGDGDKDNTTSTAPKIVLNGNFKQYNWVNEDDKNAVSDSNAKTIISTALSVTDFNHTINGKTASNLGIIYLNEFINVNGLVVENNTGLPYDMRTVTMLSQTRSVYSLKNANADQICSDTENADKTTVNDWYKPQFKYSADLGDQYIAKTDDCDEFVYREGNTDTIKVMFPAGDTKELNLASMVEITKYSGQPLDISVACEDPQDKAVTVNQGKVTLSNAGEYKVTYTVVDTLFYDKDGNVIEPGATRAVARTSEITYTWVVTVDVSLKETAIPNARFAFDSTVQKIYRSGNSNIVQFIPFLSGLEIYDYDVNGNEYLRFDGGDTSKTTDYNKIAKASIANNKESEGEGNHIVTIELTDGGKLIVDLDVRANTGSGTHTGSIKVRNNVIYVVNNGTTSGKGQTWKIYSYKFVGNNGTEINSGLVTFGTSGVDCDTATKPSSNFGTTIKYTVSYDANGGNCGQNTGYATSVATAVTLPAPARSGYVFNGWYTAASDGTRVGGAGDSYTPSANITLYAQWGKPCDVTYDANGGSCGTASEKYTGTALTLPTPTRDGYWFIGWYDAAEGGNKIGDAGAKYNPSGAITLYAHWQEAIKYTVTYNANGGSCGTASATYEGTALTLPTPTRTGYTFNGWYTAASGGTKIGGAGASYIPSANITLYAQWKINSYTISVTTNNATVKVNGTTVNNDGTVSIQYGAQVTVEVTYTESNDRSTTIKGTDGTTYTSPFTMPAQNVTINATSSGCVTPDTLITLADGSQVRVDSLTGNEELLVWNLKTGKYDTAPIVFVDNDAETAFEIIHLYFSDGSDVKVIYEHGFFDLDLGKYVYIDATNYADYIGHRFVAEGDIKKDNWNVVTLDKVVLETEVTTAWSPVTFEHLCYYTNGVLSMPGGIEGLFNIFEVDTNTMRYDVNKMEKDIETYGLFTLDDFGGMITEDAFRAFNGAYLKVAMGKGLLTWEDIAYMAERYIPLM